MTNGYALSIRYQTRLPTGSRVWYIFPANICKKELFAIPHKYLESNLKKIPILDIVDYLISSFNPLISWIPVYL